MHLWDEWFFTGEVPARVVYLGIQIFAESVDGFGWIVVGEAFDWAKLHAQSNESSEVRWDGALWSGEIVHGHVGTTREVVPRWHQSDLF